MKVFIAEDNELEMAHFKNMILREADLIIVGDAVEGNTALTLINALKLCGFFGYNNARNFWCRN